MKCLAGKDVCSGLPCYDEGGASEKSAHCGTHYLVAPHHTDGTPCGDGCKIGKVVLVCPGCGENVEWWHYGAHSYKHAGGLDDDGIECPAIVRKSQEKPGPVGECKCKCHDPGWKCFNCDCLKDDPIAEAIWKIAHIVKTDLYPEAIVEGVRSLQAEIAHLHKTRQDLADGYKIGMEKAEAERDAAEKKQDEYYVEMNDLSAQVGVLVEALHPFATLGWKYLLNIYLRGVPDGIFVKIAGGEDGPLGFDVGDLRRARKAFPGDPKTRPTLSNLSEVTQERKEYVEGLEKKLSEEKNNAAYWIHHCKISAKRADDAKAENTRYRKTLEKISQVQGGADKVYCLHIIEWCATFAQAALHPEEKS